MAHLNGGKTLYFLPSLCCFPELLHVRATRHQGSGESGGSGQKWVGRPHNQLPGKVFLAGLWDALNSAPCSMTICV